MQHNKQNNIFDSSQISKEYNDPNCYGLEYIINDLPNEVNEQVSNETFDDWFGLYELTM